LVGINTVITDDPLLTPRPSGGKKPVRVVLDNNLRIPLDCQLLASAEKCPVIVATSLGTVESHPQQAEAIRKKGVEVLALPDEPGKSNLYSLVDELSSRGVSQLLVEGGPSVIGSFLDEGLADEICVYIAPKLLGSAGTAEISGPLSRLSEALELKFPEIKCFEDNVRLTGLSKKAMEDISITLD
jgi:diaminohydroxyphosphoribosylaminopyrimidine deaminase/5-amino-6-(5-phosphoribosylamino)uracil reductase